jgi:hypothetical protein
MPLVTAVTSTLWSRISALSPRPFDPRRSKYERSTATAPVIESASRLPPTRFHGCSPSVRMSEPMRKIGVAPPLRMRHCAKPITTGVASATPSTDNALKRSRSSSSEGSSKHLVPRGTIHRSASA